MESSQWGTKFDYGVCERQKFGATFRKGEASSTEAQRLKNGELELLPHGVWSGNLLNWDADPYHDRNWRFQRHSLRWAMPLVHEATNGDEEAAEMWQALALSWSRAHQETPKRSSERWYDMAVGLRAIALTLGASAISESVMDEYADELRRHRDVLLDPRNLAKQNHALHQHQGLYVVSSFLRDSHGKERAVERMERQFTQSFDGQGLNDEGSSHYQKLNISWWRHAWERVKRENGRVPADVTSKLSSGESVVAHMTTPAGYLIHVGDGGRTKIATGFSKYTDWVVTEGATGRSPGGGVTVLDGGFLFSRSSWNRSGVYFASRFGSDATQGHAHKDQMALWYSALGIDWFVDSGFWSYERNDPIVDYLSSRQAHNVPDLGAVDFDASRQVELLRSRVDPEYRDFIMRDHRFGELNLRRRLVYIGSIRTLFVIDSASGANSDQKLWQNWNLGYNIGWLAKARGGQLSYGSSKISMHWLQEGTACEVTSGTEDSFDGWLYPKWKARVPSVQVRNAVTGPAPITVTAICPRSYDAVSVDVVERTGYGKISVVISIDGM